MVLCYRCLKIYDQSKAPFTKTKGLRIKENAANTADASFTLAEEF